jgi:hypothetical protein
MHCLWKEGPSDSKVCVNVQPSTLWNCLPVPTVPNCCHALNFNLHISVEVLNMITT